jgi:2-dehydro-3-deoxyphosphogluconate aldolase/(4S)-4-hydroxy-2-oxoglutarate aldolase
VLRASSAQKALIAARALIEGGCAVIEVTLSVPEAARVIRELAVEGIPVGAGTVMDLAGAQMAIAAGAQFLVSPRLNRDVLAYGAQHGILVIPGALTPTEVLDAHDAGAKLIKIFPVAAMGGPRYLKLLRDPFPFLRFFPTGGVTLEDAPHYLANGALALGVGGALASTDAVEAEDVETLKRNARHWCRALESKR